MRGRLQPDNVGEQGDLLVEGVGRPVIKRRVDGHESFRVFSFEFSAAELLDLLSFIFPPFTAP
jgi:hypothetical protein